MFRLISTPLLLRYLGLSIISCRSHSAISWVVPAWSALSTGPSIGQRLARRIRTRSNRVKFYIPRLHLFRVAFSAAVELFNAQVRTDRSSLDLDQAQLCFGH